MFSFTIRKKKMNTTKTIVPTFSAFAARLVAEIESSAASLIEKCLEALQNNLTTLLSGRAVYVTIPTDVAKLAHKSAVVGKTITAFINAGWPCQWSSDIQLVFGPCADGQLPAISSIIEPIRQAKINEHVTLILAMVEGHKDKLAELGSLKFTMKQHWNSHFTLAACEKLYKAGWNIKFDVSEITIKA